MKDTQVGIFIGANDGGAGPQFLTLKGANCHGLIAGATGTGKTLTLQNLAEAFSRAGTPVFLADVIKELGVGEALTSFLDAKGRPGVVERTLIRPPTSRLVPATERKRKKVIEASPVAGRYEKEIDRESAFEILQARAEKAAGEAEAAEKAEAEERRKALEAKEREKAERVANRSRRGSSRSCRSDSVIETAAKSAARSVARSLGRELVRGLMGMLRR